jgi:hypothetical protein
LPPYGSIAVLSTERENKAQASHQDVCSHGFSQARLPMLVQRLLKQKVSPIFIDCLITPQ